MVKWALVLAAVLALASACADVGRAPQAGGSPVSTPTANIASSSSTPTVTPGSDASALLSEAIRGLEQAKSYRFIAQAVHHWQAPEGQEYDWAFEGDGAAVPPSRFYSKMRGPADAFFEMRIIDGKVTNIDTRGQRPEASTAFGGPGTGAGPYTVISYLKNSTAHGQVQTASLNGAETRQFMFVPNLARVSALDASHKGLQDRVRTVQGSAWIDSKTGRLTQETVTVQSTDSNGFPETVTITIRFTDYDSPVEIK